MSSFEKIQFAGKIKRITWSHASIDLNKKSMNNCRLNLYGTGEIWLSSKYLPTAKLPLLPIRKGKKLKWKSKSSTRWENFTADRNTLFSLHKFPWGLWSTQDVSWYQRGVGLDRKVWFINDSLWKRQSSGYFATPTRSRHSCYNDK